MFIKKKKEKFYPKVKRLVVPEYERRQRRTKPEWINLQVCGQGIDLPWIIVCTNNESKKKQLSVLRILSKLAQFLIYSYYF